LKARKGRIKRLASRRFSARPRSGSRISKEGLRTKRSYSETMLTRSKNTALTDSCQLQSDRG
jgi:hypothetical protein